MNDAAFLANHAKGLLLAASLAIVAAIWAVRAGRERIHVTKMTVDRPFEFVWKWVSDPNRYADIYPNWVKKVADKGGGKFFVEDQFGKAYDLTCILKKEDGIVDLEFGSEVSRLRVFPLDESSTALVHVAKRWKGINWLTWFLFQINVDRDFKHAKSVIETANG